MAIISFSRRLVFLKTRKVAGTSVEALIRPFLGDDDIVPAVTPRDEFFCAQRGAFSRNYLARSADELKYTELVLQGRFDDAAHFLKSCKKVATSHMSYAQLKKTVERKGHKISDFCVFTIERHPYDWLLSMLLYDNSSYNKTGNALSSTNVRALNQAAERYLNRPDVKDKINWSMYAAGNQVLVDRVIRFERLKRELDEVICRFIPECDVSELPTLKENKTRLDASTAFSLDVKRRVQNIFNLVFSYLGYDT